jgi:hypothetical protein
MIPKATRWSVTQLPCIAALATLALRELFAFRRRSFHAVSAACLLSVLLCIHNNFRILPLPDVMVGPLKLFAASFPLNIPDWYDDNHPLERRDFLHPLYAAEDFIAQDAASRHLSNVEVQLTAAGMYLDHDFMNAVALFNGHKVNYGPWSYSGPGGSRPDYILEPRGHRQLHVGTYYYLWVQNVSAFFVKNELKYDAVAQFQGPAGTTLVVYRQQRVDNNGHEH